MCFIFVGPVKVDPQRNPPATEQISMFDIHSRDFRKLSQLFDEFFMPLRRITKGEAQIQPVIGFSESQRPLLHVTMCQRFMDDTQNLFAFSGAHRVMNRPTFGFYPHFQCAESSQREQNQDRAASRQKIEPQADGQAETAVDPDERRRRHPADRSLLLQHHARPKKAETGDHVGTDARRFVTMELPGKDENRGAQGNQNLGA